MPETVLPISPLIAVMAIAAVTTAWMTGLSWRHRRRDHVARLVALNGLAFLWTAFALVYHVSDDPAFRHVVLDIRIIPITLIPVAWISFASAASGVGRVEVRELALLLVIPVMTLFLLATNPMHNLLFIDVFKVVRPSSIVAGHEFGPWFWVHASYSFCLMMAGVVAMGIRTYRSHPSLRAKSLLLLVGALAPTLLCAAYLMFKSAFGWIDPTPVGFAVSTLCYGLGVFRYRILDLTPVSPTLMVSALDEARVVMTSAGRVSDINATAEGLLGVDSDELIGAHATGTLRSLWRLRGREGTHQEVELTDTPWPGWFEVVLTPILPTGPQPLGPSNWLLRIRNITERKTRDLALLDRAEHAEVAVAQHEETLRGIGVALRPKLQGIQGLAGAIAEDTEGEAAGYAALIEEASKRMEAHVGAQLFRALGTAGKVSSSDTEPRRRPSRAPVPRSASGPRDSGTLSTDPTP